MFVSYLRVVDAVSNMTLVVVEESGWDLVKGVNIVLEVAVPEVEGISTCRYQKCMSKEGASNKPTGMYAEHLNMA